MPSLNRMYQLNGKKAMPHAGNLLQKVLLEKHVTRAELSRRLGIRQVGLNRYIYQPTLHAALLWKIGLLLDYNFFEVLNNEFPVQSNKISENEERLKQEVIDLKKEIELYKKVLKL